MPGTGEGDRREAVEGRQRAPELGFAPSTMLGVIPLPRFAGEDRRESACQFSALG
jgi:hypothetical protein